jgi:NMD protein affecting ribosome stability and mRNA decay
MSATTIMCPSCGTTFRYHGYEPTTLAGRLCVACWVKSHPATPISYPRGIMAPEVPTKKEEVAGEKEG